jgi:hypothetical protein
MKPSSEEGFIHSKKYLTSRVETIWDTTRRFLSTKPLASYSDHKLFTSELA